MEALHGDCTVVSEHLRLTGMFWRRGTVPNQTHIASDLAAAAAAAALFGLADAAFISSSGALAPSLG